MPDPAPRSHILRLADLAQRRETAFELAPDAAARAALARDLGIDGVKKLRFAGTLTPLSGRDWQLDATLGATVVQPCVVSLAPVTTRIDTDVTRRYLADWQEPDTTGEVEMPEDDTAEALPATLDLNLVLAEALALALPDFPRAQGVELGEAVFTEAGKTPMRDEDTRPFAGLAGLREALEPPKDE
ncbi:YceD family protein [Oceaniglobus ichthyenteri]|uniref:YceD family protein n=1 Tax=Oceaniglobus ichthyenteri TaxID=2136177 RepID=UPI000D3AC223|nr:YceD family protein [Oceaniglobus ichthyenteri]